MTIHRTWVPGLIVLAVPAYMPHKEDTKAMVVGDEEILTTRGPLTLTESAILIQQKDARLSTDSQLQYLMSWDSSQLFHTRLVI